MLSVTRKFSFSYAHHLPEYEGDCKNLHGHNSDVEVEFWDCTLLPEAYPTMVIDFKDLDKYIKPIINELDHKNLNDIFGTTPPTAETIVLYIVNEIKVRTPFGEALARIKVSETNNSYATWRP